VGIPVATCLDTQHHFSLTRVFKQADAQISKEASEGWSLLVDWLGLVIEIRDVLTPERHQLVVSPACAAHVVKVVSFEQCAEPELLHVRQQVLEMLDIYQGQRRDSTTRCWCRDRIYILSRRGPDTDLKRWGLRLAERGGKRAKKKAVIAVARKLGILLHRLWVAGEVYEPLRNHNLGQLQKKVAA
jgi:hypothetical protein